MKLEIIDSNARIRSVLHSPGKTIHHLWVAFLLIQSLLGYSSHGEMISTKIGILYSKNSEDYFGYPFEFRQLYTSVQSQSIQAGVPFDLIKESDLGDVNKLSKYKAIIIPALQVVDQTKVDTYRINIKSLLEDYGVSIVAAGAFFSYNASGQYQDFNTELAMEEIFGLDFGVFGYQNDITMSAPDIDHPIISMIEAPERLAEYNSTFFQEFIPSAGNESDQIAIFNINNENKIAIQSGTRGRGKFVHFADMKKMIDSKILWAAIKWAVSDSGNPQSNIHLSMTREGGLFIPRNDMDLSRFASAIETAEVPQLDYLKRWKADYDFNGSFYINIGNDQQLGEYTNWDLSGPLYKDYIAIGNEIGTHSYTHPNDTKLLSPNELEFEFLQSKIEISENLEISVNGTGIPGEDENLYVYDNIKSNFDYISGHTLYSDSRHVQSLGIGHLTPDEDTVYFSLNMTPDFVLGSIQQLNLEEFSQTWIDEFDKQSTNTRQPTLHWLWHDYGLMNPFNSPNYDPKPYEDILAYASAAGFEFITLSDYTKRFTSFKNSEVLVEYIDFDKIDVAVQGSELGGLSLELPVGKTITSAGNHYAYDGNKLFLPADGGNFSITTGQSPEDVTKVASLGSNLELISISGNGTILDFVVEGHGQAIVEFKSFTLGAFEVISSGDTTYTSTGAIINFKDIGNYAVQIRSTTNLVPYAVDQDVTTLQGQPITVQLQAGDYDGLISDITISKTPENGAFSLNELLLTYSPNPDFLGTDQLIYTVTDNKGAKADGLVTVNINSDNITDGDPEYNYLFRPALIDGDSSEWEGLESIGQDPVDLLNTNDLLDYTNLTVAHNDAKLFIFYSSSNAAPLNWAHNTFIDSDSSSLTGYTIGNIGADLLVQGDFIYKYAGSGLDWTWEQISNIDAAVSGADVELCISRSLFEGVTSIRLVLLADNSAYPDGSGLDLFPDDIFSSNTGYFTYKFFSESVNSIPIAQPAAFSMNAGESLNITLQGIDADNDSLTYQITSQPQNGILSGLSSSQVYTPSEGFSGVDTFSFLVSDGVDDSQIAIIEITVFDPNNNNNMKVSNGLAQDLLIDGNLDDWESLAPYPLDPIDQIDDFNKADLVRVMMAHSDTELFIAIENATDIEFNWAYNIFLDVDLNPTTGFRHNQLFTDLGAEYLVQSNYIFKYTGSGSDWSWEFIGSANAFVSGEIAEMSMPTSYIGSPDETNFVVVGDNYAYQGGNKRDLYPDDSVSAGGLLNYHFDSITMSEVTQANPQLFGPVPPSVPHTFRIKFVEPAAINPNRSTHFVTPTKYLDIRMAARPNATWRLEHSSDLSDWKFIRSWQIIGSLSEFVFPIPENADGYGFFDIIESTGSHKGK